MHHRPPPRKHTSHHAHAPRPRRTQPPREIAEVASSAPTAEDFDAASFAGSENVFRARCKAAGLSLGASIEKWRQVCEQKAMAEMNALLQKIETASVEEQESEITKQASSSKGVRVR